ncbi:MAG: hypothetical protein KDE08_03230 [Rhodobacteraceae bacterium]|nr:hypothetical protein [Paracoccaceae bacterium]
MYGDDCQALAVAANKTGTSIAENPARLTFRAEENSGLVLADVISDAGTLTFGLIFWPEAGADPRTLLSLQPRGEDDYLFLSGDGGVFRAAQKSEQMELALPPQAADAAARILICAISGSALRLCLDFGPVAATPLDSPFQGRADLFIGCRNARAGLRRKLGAFGLTDVMAWPGEDLLSVPDSPALEAVKAVWRDRCAHAI